MNKLKNLYKSYFKNFSSIIIHLVSIHIFFFILLIFVKVIFTLLGKNEWINYLYQYLTIPPNWSIYITRPWVIFTYFLINTNLTYLFFNMILLYKFGNMLSQFLSARHSFSIYISGILITGIFFIILSLSNNVGIALVGCLPGIYSIIFACIAFAPNYPINLFFFGTIKLRYLSIFFILLSISKLSDGRIVNGSIELFGALWGFIYIKLLSKGIDLGKPFVYIFNMINKIFNSKKKSGDIYVSYKRKRKR